MIADAAPLVGSVIRIERLLSGPELDRHVLEVDADAGPCAKSAAHRIHEHVDRFQMRARVRVTDLPSLEACQSVSFFLGASNFDKGVRRRSPP